MRHCGNFISNFGANFLRCTFLFRKGQWRRYLLQQNSLFATELPSGTSMTRFRFTVFTLILQYLLTRVGFCTGKLSKLASDQRDKFFQPWIYNITKNNFQIYRENVLDVG
jgi:hypothetical protein